jgi:hypothetical protein
VTIHAGPAAAADISGDRHPQPLTDHQELTMSDPTPDRPFADEDTDADPVAPHCDGFPTICPNPVTVPPAPPHHGGGIRCGCYDEETA